MKIYLAITAFVLLALPLLLRRGETPAALAESEKLAPEEGRSLALAIVHHAMGRKAESDAEMLEGEPIQIEATGLLARALQPEVDHLNGILFIDRMSSVAKATLQSRLKRLRKETLRDEKNAARASQINL